MPTRTRRPSLRDLSVRGKLTALAVVAVAALAIFATMALSTLSSVRIGSSRYQVISDNNALLADVLPPPEYLVEANLVAHQMFAAAGDTARSTSWPPRRRPSARSSSATGRVEGEHHDRPRHAS